MRAVAIAVVVSFTCTLAHAENVAGMVSRYRREHGSSTVKTDPQLTAIAERQAKSMAASGGMDHSAAGSFASRISGVRTAAAAENILRLAPKLGQIPFAPGKCVGAIGRKPLTSQS